jgi:ribosomal protein S18 acetylase RimI-like enzyme
MALEDHDLEQTALPLRPAIDGSDIRKLGADDVPTIARALARAFDDDPIMNWVFPSDSRRPARLEAAFALYLRRVWLPEEECYGADRLFGAALWLPPGKWNISLGRQVRLLPSMISVNGRDLPRLLRVLHMMETAHPEEPHYYLAVLGVEPELQGRGFGSALMQPVLARCDRERIPAYLESSKRRNVALYERHGFRVVEEMKLPNDGPPLWRMWREPAA